MKTKEEYIAERVEFFEKKKEFIMNALISSINARVEEYKNLSDEEYEEILEKERLKDEEFAEEDAKLLSKLNELGISLEEFDNMSIEEIEEGFPKK